MIIELDGVARARGRRRHPSLAKCETRRRSKVAELCVIERPRFRCVHGTRRVEGRAREAPPWFYCSGGGGGSASRRSLGVAGAEKPDERPRRGDRITRAQVTSWGLGPVCNMARVRVLLAVGRTVEASGAKVKRKCGGRSSRVAKLA